MARELSISDLARSGAILATGIVYGTDAFFTIVGASALARTSAASLTDVMGRLHEVADRRMVFVGATGLLLSSACMVSAPTTRGRMVAAVAVGSQIAYVVLYSRCSKPINIRLTAGARSGEIAPETHALQRRWDRVVRVRFGLMAVSVLCLALVV